MSDVRSKNRYELLGNDPEEDSDREPEPLVKVADKTAPRHGKRDVPTQPRGGNIVNARGRGGRFTGNEQAFRDRNAGAHNNRAKPTDEIPREGRVPVTAVKNRDIRGNRIRDDRHSRTDKVDTNKQVEQGWGAPTGESNWKDEQAGEAIAQKEEKETGTTPEDNDIEGDTVDKEAEPEDKSKSYAEYLAELQENKQPDLGIKEARKPNEGSKTDKKWTQAKELKRLDEDETYIKGREEKARRERQRKEKAFVDVDMRFVEQPRGRGDGPRGRGRGGDRGRGGRGRGDTFRPRGGEGAPRGGRGNPSGPTVDEKNFPSLGASK